MVTTRENLVVITQENTINKSNYIDTKKNKNNTHTHKDSKIRNQEQWIYKRMRKKISKMAIVSHYLKIITLNINGLYYSI